jgi:hypothetical protein
MILGIGPLLDLSAGRGLLKLILVGDMLLGKLIFKFKTERKINMTVVAGKYRHYKGNEYQVIGIARHSEDESELVVYRPLYGEQGLWVRPLAMFSETVMIDDIELPRFALIEPE